MVILGVESIGRFSVLDTLTVLVQLYFNSNKFTNTSTEIIRVIFNIIRFEVIISDKVHKNIVKMQIYSIKYYAKVILKEFIGKFNR